MSISGLDIGTDSLTNQDLTVRNLFTNQYESGVVGYRPVFLNQDSEPLTLKGTQSDPLTFGSRRIVISDLFQQDVKTNSSTVVGTPDDSFGLTGAPVESLLTGDQPIFVDETVSETNFTVQQQQSAEVIKANAFHADARFTGVTGRGYSVVVLDTGIDLNHSFFGPDRDNNGIADRIVYQYDFADRDNDASDYSGHGSNVTSIIASQDSTYKGIAPDVNIIALKVFGNNGSGSFSVLRQALDWVAANVENYNILALNMSLGNGGNYTEYQSSSISNVLNTIASKNVISVAAAGNSFAQYSSAQGVSYPAADPNTFAVGATFDSNIGSISFSSGASANTSNVDVITPFSQRDKNLTTVFAPGAAITGANANGGLSTYYGTSQATPQITGTAILAQQLAIETLGRRLTPTELKQLVQSTGTTIIDGDDENDNVTNTNLSFKRVDILALGNAIKAMASPILPVIDPVIQFSNSSITLNEGNTGNTLYTYDVVLDKVSSQPITVAYSTSNGTAIAGSDYVSSTGTLTIPAGFLSGSINVASIGDTLVESDETFSLNLSDARGATLGVRSMATGTIANDDVPSINITPANISQNEGNTDLTAFTYTVSLDQVSNKVITVAYHTTNGTAIAGSDYVANNGYLTFEPGALTKTIVVNSIGDTLVEGDETFGLNLSSASNGILRTAFATGTILNDDSPLPIASLTPTPISNYERSSGIQNYSFTVNLDKASDRIIQIGYSTDDGTATLAGSDYVNNDRTLTFKAGETSKVINVQVRGDRIKEANEFFTLSLNDGINSTISSTSSKATINILDDDNIPVVSAYSKTLAFTEGNNPIVPKNVSFAVELSSAATKNVTVNYSLLSETAKVNEDYLGTTGALTFKAGETFKYISVPVIGDTLVEANETFTLRLDRANDALLNPDALTTQGIIFNDDRATTSIRGLSDYLGSSASINRDELLRSSSDVFPVNTGLTN